ncbi:RHS repeat-associated core domain-containing protein [Facilibium subflavum]|uniref:RHS repeat-associated core domain-containing protein n=1 Tax=Facilibium subflavum TaxID=2219058 RepID=UPI000E64BE8F|nr:RHS repeat-associated core domain-containing protein [Facilibium subflavum]
MKKKQYKRNSVLLALTLIGLCNSTILMAQERALTTPVSTGDAKYYVAGIKGVKLLLSPSGQYQSVSYLAFGKDKSSGSQLQGKTGDFLYNGEYQDAATHLQYLKSRNYNLQTLQRFQTRDTKVNEWNKYSYTLGDPNDFSDPSGHSFGLYDGVNIAFGLGTAKSIYGTVRGLLTLSVTGLGVFGLVMDATALAAIGLSEYAEHSKNDPYSNAQAASLAANILFGVNMVGHLSDRIAFRPRLTTDGQQIYRKSWLFGNKTKIGDILGLDEEEYEYKYDKFGQVDEGNLNEDVQEDEAKEEVDNSPPKNDDQADEQWRENLLTQMISGFERNLGKFSLKSTEYGEWITQEDSMRMTVKTQYVGGNTQYENFKFTKKYVLRVVKENGDWTSYLTESYST